MVLCLGQFFTASDACEKEWKECLDGEIQSPIQLYILGPVSLDQEPFFSHLSIEDGGEMCFNITYLGNKCFHKMQYKLSPCSNINFLCCFERR